MMRHKVWVLSVIMLLVVVSMGWAAVTITYPVNGQVVGPSTQVKGVASQKAFMVVYTKVFRPGEDKLLRKVPGIRHWTKENGSFVFRIATPRVYGAPNMKLIYKIHVRAYSQPASGKNPPDLGEVVITVKSQ